MVEVQEVGFVGTVLAVDEALKSLPSDAFVLSLQEVLDPLVTEGRTALFVGNAILQEHLDGQLDHPDFDPCLQLIVNPTQIAFRRNHG